MVVGASQPEMGQPICVAEVERLIEDAPGLGDGSRCLLLGVALAGLRLSVVLDAGTGHDRCPAVPLKHASQVPAASIRSHWHAAGTLTPGRVSGGRAMLGYVTGGRATPLDEEPRRDIIIAFLGAGLRQPPSRALAVAALASARRVVAAHRARGEPIRGWLAGEIQLAGIRENAAALAAMEVPGYRHQTAQAYALHHPDRLKALNDFLAALT
jgi:hypothetical protein